MSKIWIAALLLPLIAGLHRYACNMGFRNMTRRAALDDALVVGLMMIGLLVGVGLLVLAGCSGEATRSGNKPDIAPMSRAAERERVLEEGRKFCERYPDDLVCPGKR
jgi:hypothetical protein